MSNKPDVSIYVKGFVDLKQLDQATKKFNIFAKTAQTTIKKATADFGKGGFTKDDFMGLDALSKQTEMFGQRVTQDLSKPIKKFKQDSVISSKQIAKEMGNLDKAFGAIEKSEQQAHAAGMQMTKQARKNFKKMTQAIKPAKIEFQGWAMSIMFFGMALKRMFDTIWKSSTKTFNDVMSSVEGTTTGFQMLDGAVKFLGFSAGQALEPIAFFLIPIIDKISQWIIENDKLFAALVVGLGVFGTFFTVLGAGVLAVAGFIAAWAPLSTVVWPILQTIGAFLAGLSGGAIAAVIAAVVLFAGAWYTNLGGIQEFVKTVFNSIFKFGKNLFKGLMEIFSGIWDIVVGLFTGDFDKVLQGLGKILVGILRLIATSVDTVIEVAAASIIFLINLVKDLMFNAASLVLGFWKTVASIIDKIAGTNYASGIQSAISKLKSLQSSWTVTAPERQGSLVDLVDILADKMMAPSVVVNIDNQQVTDGISTQIGRGA